MSRARVSVVARNLAPHGNFAGSIADGLRERGLEARAFADHDAAAMDTDVVLLVGQPSSCRRTIGRIERAGRTRPGVAAWLFEPLPPPEIPLERVRSAIRYSAIRTGRSWTRPIFQLISRPHDAALDRETGRGLGPLGIRFLIDTAGFALRGSDRGWLDRIFVSTEQKRLQLLDWGMASEFLPVGQQAEFGRDLHLERDIDVLFIGSLKSRRRQSALAGLFRELEARGMVVKRPEAGLWGDERTELVNRARILLHLHQYDWDTPWMRWCLAAANGAVIASEPLSVPCPFRPGIDYLEASIDDLPDAVCELARDAPRLSAMLAASRSAIARNMMQAASLDRLAGALAGIALRGKAP